MIGAVTWVFMVVTDGSGEEVKNEDPGGNVDRKSSRVHKFCVRCHSSRSLYKFTGSRKFFSPEGRWQIFVYELEFGQSRKSVYFF